MQEMQLFVTAAVVNVPPAHAMFWSRRRAAGAAGVVGAGVGVGVGVVVGSCSSEVVSRRQPRSVVGAGGQQRVRRCGGALRAKSMGR